MPMSVAIVYFVAIVGPIWMPIVLGALFVLDEVGRTTKVVNLEKELRLRA